MNQGGLKNTIIGLVVGGAVVAGGYTLFSDNSGAPSVSGDYERTDSQTETRTSLSSGEADKDCKDFRTQREAQAFFEASGGPLSDPHNLDRDGDGIVCESLK